jgi:Zn-ribbon RNA-binding protein
MILFVVSMKCISCDKKTVQIVKFPCPICKTEIVRCDKCRKLSISYKCLKCEHKGP